MSVCDYTHDYTFIHIFYHIFEKHPILRENPHYTRDYTFKNNIIVLVDDLDYTHDYTFDFPLIRILSFLLNL